MSSKILFPTSNVSPDQAVNIIKTGLNNEYIPIKTRRLAIEQVAYMERCSSGTKDELAKALRWVFNHYDLDEDI